MFEFTKSTRSIAVVIVMVGASVALFLNKLTGQDYMTLASIVVTAYFAKRDTSEDRG